MIIKWFRLESFSFIGQKLKEIFVRFPVLFESQSVKWTSCCRSLKTKIQLNVPLFVVWAIVWLLLSILVCRLASLNENKRRARMYNERNLQSSKEKTDSLWKEHVRSNLADMQNEEEKCLGKLDSLNKGVSHAEVELRKMNKTLRNRKSK